MFQKARRVFQGFVLLGHCFSLLFAEDRGQPQGRGSSWPQLLTEHHFMSLNHIQHDPSLLLRLLLEALSGQVCLTPMRGCSSWCTTRQHSLLWSVGTPVGGQHERQCSPHHPVVHWGWHHGAELCYRARGQVGYASSTLRISKAGDRSSGCSSGSTGKAPAPKPQPKVSSDSCEGKPFLKGWFKTVFAFMQRQCGFP